MAFDPGAPKTLEPVPRGRARIHGARHNKSETRVSAPDRQIHDPETFRFMPPAAPEE